MIHFLITILAPAITKSKIKGIHKLNTLTEFWGFLTPLPLRWKVYLISFCSIVDIWATSSRPLACQRSLWMPPYQDILQWKSYLLKKIKFDFALKIIVLRQNSKKVQFQKIPKVYKRCQILNYRQRTNFHFKFFSFGMSGASLGTNNQFPLF